MRARSGGSGFVWGEEWTRVTAMAALRDWYTRRGDASEPRGWALALCPSIRLGLGLEWLGPVRCILELLWAHVFLQLGAHQLCLLMALGDGNEDPFQPFDLVRWRSTASESDHPQQVL